MFKHNAPFVEAELGQLSTHYHTLLHTAIMHCYILFIKHSAPGVEAELGQLLLPRRPGGHPLLHQHHLSPRMCVSSNMYKLEYV
jgi:hypothetical protein